jgi:hypothetical protein|tara:strand:+ start:1983 stop:2300 length:318 start_codon:yes stop_codon:yes gene_type:complete
MELIYFVLSAYGLTQILIYGSIFNKIRPSKSWLSGFGILFHCPMCMGFWIGLFLFGINEYTELFTFEYTFANALILGWLSSGTCYLLSMLVNDFGLKLNHRSDDD